MEVTKQLIINRVILLMVASMLVLTCFPKIIHAGDTQNSEDWQFMGELYLWYASIGGEVATGNDLDIGADDLIDNLNLAFMGNIGTRKDRWGFMIDAIYLNASDSENNDTSIGGVKTNVELTSWIVAPMVGYRVLDSEHISLDVVAGARYLYLDTEVDLRNADPASASFSISGSDSGSNWDGIVGLRGDILLSDHWFIPYHFDIGTGDSDFTWQAFAGLGYHFKSFDILAGYRYLSWEFDDNTIIGELSVDGVGVGIKFYF